MDTSGQRPLASGGLATTPFRLSEWRVTKCLVIYMHTHIGIYILYIMYMFYYVMLCIYIHRDMVAYILNSSNVMQCDN